MNTIENPFLDRGSVHEPAQFFGRRGEVRKLVQALGARVPQSVSIIGERRIGKTSLLNFLSAPTMGALVEFSHLLSRQENEYLFVRADLSGLKTGELNGQLFFFRLLFKNLEKAVREKTGQIFPVFEQYWENKSIAELVEFGLGSYLDEVQHISPNLAIIFLLDEADFLIRQGVGTLLRSLIQKRPIAFVICTRLPLAEIDPEREVSPLFNMLAETIALGLLAESEARQMVTTLSGNTFTPLELDFILRTGGQHPDFTCIAARRVWDHKQENHAFVSDVIFSQLVVELESACQGLRASMTPDEQAVCERLSRDGRIEKADNRAMQILKRKGVVNAQNALFSPVFTDFLTRKNTTFPIAPTLGELRFGDGYVIFGDTVAQLSPLEQKLLLTLYEHIGQVCTREEIHRALWGSEYQKSGDATKINIAIQRLRQSLGESLQEKIKIEAVRGSGYRLSI